MHSNRLVQTPFGKYGEFMYLCPIDCCQFCDNRKAPDMKYRVVQCKDYFYYHLCKPHRKGFGIHSPFVYQLVREVFSKRGRYAGTFFDTHTEADESLSFTDHTGINDRVSFATHKQSDKMGLRVDSYLKENKPGCNSRVRDPQFLHLSLQNRLMIWYGITEAVEVENASFSCAPAQLQNTECDNLSSLPNIIAPGICYFNTLQTAEPYFFEGFDWSMCKSNDMVLIYGIHSTGRAYASWKQLILHPHIRLTLDLWDVGVVLFDTRLTKQHFVVYSPCALRK